MQDFDTLGRKLVNPFGFEINNEYTIYTYVPLTKKPRTLVTFLKR